MDMIYEEGYFECNKFFCAKAEKMKAMDRKFVTCILLLLLSLVINVTVIIVFNSPAYLSIFTKKWNFLSNSCCAARVRFRYLMRKKVHRQIK